MTPIAIASNAAGGLVLRGVLHKPANSGGEPVRAALLLPGLSGNRVGPHRLLLDLADRLAAKGVAVLRADPLGTGWSDGAPEDQTFDTLLRDAKTLTRWLRQGLGASEIALGGICRGARVALAAALAEPDIARLLLLSCAPIAPEIMNAKRARRRWHHARQYLRKALSPRHLARLFTGQVRLGLVGQALLRPVPEGRLASESDTGEEALGHLNARTLFLYGETDPDRESSIEFYRKRVNCHAPVQFQTIPGADHGYYATRWHRAVTEAVEAWWDAPAQ